MPHETDPYRRLSKRELYRNPWLVVETHDIVHPSGARGEHVLVSGGRASGVLAVEDGAFLFTRQPRFAARSWVVEVVKGGAEEDESALQCAQREMREELGLEAQSWVPLGVAYEIPSIMEEPVHLFLARDLTRVPTEPEHVETIEPLRMPIDDAYRAKYKGSPYLAPIIGTRARSATIATRSTRR